MLSRPSFSWDSDLLISRDLLAGVESRFDPEIEASDAFRRPKNETPFPVLLGKGFCFL